MTVVSGEKAGVTGKVGEKVELTLIPVTERVEWTLSQVAEKAELTLNQAEGRVELILKETVTGEKVERAEWIGREERVVLTMKA